MKTSSLIDYHHSLRNRTKSSTLRDDVLGLHYMDVLQGCGEWPNFRHKSPRMEVLATGSDRRRGVHAHYIIASIYQPGQYTGICKRERSRISVSNFYLTISNKFPYF